MNCIRTSIASLCIFAACWLATAQDPAPAPPPADPAAAAAPPPAEAPPPPPPPPPQPLDIPIRQVQIQVWISQTDEDGLREIGSNLNYVRRVRDDETGAAVERVRTNTFDPTSGPFTTVLPAPDGGPYRDNVRLTPESNTPWTPGNILLTDPNNPEEFFVDTRAGAGLTYSIIDDDRGTIEGLIRAIESKTDSDLISKPSLLVVDKAKATIKTGDEIPYQNVEYKNGQPVLGITWKPIGVNIQLMPQILGEGLIAIDITQLEVIDRLRDTPIQGLQVPIFSTRSQSGSVLIPNGESLVIGGLSSRVVRSAERRVPIVGKLPFVGAPFRGRRNEALNSHLLVFIMPTEVNLRDTNETMQGALDFWRETEWRNRERIEEEIQYMEDSL
ncbi:MAG: hypothetical protein AMXMBFR84_06100 [Candidatus Hydrogenedentota bacterium]